MVEFKKKCVNMCVYIIIRQCHIKNLVKIHDTLGEYVQQKKVCWKVIFSEHGSTGSRVHKSQQEQKSSALKFLLMLFSSLKWL